MYHFTNDDIWDIVHNDFEGAEIFSHKKQIKGFYTVVDLVFYYKNSFYSMKYRRLNSTRRFGIEILERPKKTWTN